MTDSKTRASRRPRRGATEASPKITWTPRQWKAISSPIRLELLALAEAEQPCSIGDLARASGRRATGLYRHVRILATAGLFEPCGQRPGPRRPEQLYRVSPIAGRFGLALAEESAAERYLRVEMAALRACGRGLRDMIRDHFKSKPAPGKPPRFHARHEITWLDDERSKKLGQIVKSLEKVIEEGRRDRRGVPHQIDLLIWRRRVFEPAAPAKRRPAAKKATRRTKA